MDDHSRGVKNGKNVGMRSNIVLLNVKNKNFSKIMFQQLSNLSLSQYIQDQNITEDRAIKTKHLSTIENVLQLLDQACDQSFDFLTKLLQNNNIDFGNKIIMVEVRGAYLIGKILKLAFHRTSLDNLFIDIQGKKTDDGSLIYNKSEQT